MISSIFVSLCLIIVISLEKCLAVCFPFWYEKYVIKARVGYVIVAIAVIITVIAFLFPISQTSSAPFHVFIFIVVFVAFSIFLWCQGKIFIVLSRIRRRIFTEQIHSTADLHNKREKAFALFFITLSFFLCWFFPLIYLVHNSIFGRNQRLYQYVL